MGWYLFEVDDSARSLLAPLQSKSEWYQAMGQLKLGAPGSVVCDLLGDVWPLWIQATENLQQPLCFLFKGEVHASGGADPDVGFIGAATVQQLAQALGAPDAYFLGLLESTKFGVNSPTGACESELAILPLLREFYSGASLRQKAVVVLRG